MEKKELEEKLRGLVIFTEGDGQGQATNITLEEELGEYAMQKVLDLFSQELDRAREEGVKMGMENAWEMVSALLDTLDINKNEEEIRILTGINKLFDREITKLALKLKNNK